LEVDGVTDLEQPLKARRLRDVERKKLIMIEAAGDHGVHEAPSTGERDRSEEQPAVGVDEVRNGMQKTNGKK
jgi:hypothetical protein